MSVSVSWGNPERTIILLTIDGRWGWEEVGDANNEINSMLQGVEYTVNIIVDARNTSLVPNDYVGNIRRLTVNPDPRVERVIVVGANRLSVSVFDILRSVYAHLVERIQFVPTINDAYAILASKDSSVG